MFFCFWLSHMGCYPSPRRTKRILYPGTMCKLPENRGWRRACGCTVWPLKNLIASFLQFADRWCDISSHVPFCLWTNRKYSRRILWGIPVRCHNTGWEPGNPAIESGNGGLPSKLMTTFKAEEVSKCVSGKWFEFPGQQHKCRLINLFWAKLILKAGRGNEAGLFQKLIFKVCKPLTSQSDPAGLDVRPYRSTSHDITALLVLWVDSPFSSMLDLSDPL